jgi:hypothetical protein
VTHQPVCEPTLKPASAKFPDISGPRGPPPGALKPALASIGDSCVYMGGISRAKFYSDILPLLQTVKLGRRHFVVVASMDRLIEASIRPAGGMTSHALKPNPGAAGERQPGGFEQA